MEFPSPFHLVNAHLRKFFATVTEFDLAVGGNILGTMESQCVSEE